MEWITVKRGSPLAKCPVCGRPDWCSVTADGIVCHCMRIVSDRPARGGGWIHRIDGRPLTHSPRPEPVEPPDLGAIYAGFQAVPELAGHARELGVSVESLNRLGTRWARIQQAWAYPMRTPGGKIVGIRLRYPDKKRSVKGGKEGLFVPDGTVGDLVEQVLVCEGPTDTAAALDMGFYAIGRPSCRGSVDYLKTVCAGRDVVVVADNDAPKTGPDGTVLRPGQDGAEALVRELLPVTHSVKLILPLRGKDLREWKQLGCTGAVLRVVIRNTRSR